MVRGISVGISERVSQRVSRLTPVQEGPDLGVGAQRHVGVGKLNEEVEGVPSVDHRRLR